jgi:hypothetical protein
MDGVTPSGLSLMGRADGIELQDQSSVGCVAEFDPLSIGADFAGAQTGLQIAGRPLFGRPMQGADARVFHREKQKL